MKQNEYKSCVKASNALRYACGTHISLGVMYG